MSTLIIYLLRNAHIIAALLTAIAIVGYHYYQVSTAYDQGWEAGTGQHEKHTYEQKDEADEATWNLNPLDDNAIRLPDENCHDC